MFPFRINKLKNQPGAQIKGHIQPPEFSRQTESVFHLRLGGFPGGAHLPAHRRRHRRGDLRVYPSGIRRSNCRAPQSICHSRCRDCRRSPVYPGGNRDSDWLGPGPKGNEHGSGNRPDHRGGGNGDSGNGNAGKHI